MAGRNRIFTVPFALWLTAVWALPTCCWSMTVPVSSASASAEAPAHHHAHHAADSSQQGSLAAQGGVLVDTSQDCAAERDVALRPISSSDSIAYGVAADLNLPHPLAPTSRRLPASVHAPPGTASPLSAFLTPLRI